MQILIPLKEYLMQQASNFLSEELPMQFELYS
ncbi:hypothetical protein J2W69_003978 [Rheinheimera soli]|uniref:Uncharacterized protein n=1 Tax=Rheinheimera soli TaxID=443616 RepID=A0ABU1W593_9GAMM|nr:hypothetical protein [Rheinheimera soli]